MVVGAFDRRALGARTDGGLVSARPLRAAVWSTHFTLGFLLIAVYLARIACRVTAGRKQPGLGSLALVKLSANILLLLLAAAHATVALVHQFVWRGGALARMAPRFAR